MEKDSNRLVGWLVGSRTCNYLPPPSFWIPATLNKKRQDKTYQHDVVGELLDLGIAADVEANGQVQVSRDHQLPLEHLGLDLNLEVENLNLGELRSVMNFRLNPTVWNGRWQHSINSSESSVEKVTQYDQEYK